jgi:hypothetical protein
MKHTLQQVPVEPIGQGFIWSARVNAVSNPSSSARISISIAAGSMEASWGVLPFFLLFLVSAISLSLL